MKHRHGTDLETLLRKSKEEKERTAEIIELNNRRISDRSTACCEVDPERKGIKGFWDRHYFGVAMTIYAVAIPTLAYLLLRIFFKG